MLKMDLDEWEFISDDAYLEIHEDGGQKFFSRTFVKDSSKSVFNNYFETPSSKSQKFVETTNLPRLQKLLIPFPVEFQESPDKEHVKQVIIEDTNEVCLAPNAITEKIKSPSTLKVDQDFVPHVFFKKMKENDFVLDMKMNSPTKSSSRGILVPQIEANKFQYEETTDDQTVETMIEKDQEDDADGLNMWKWSLTGIGAICSFGVAAAATICIIILGNGQKQRKLQNNHQKLQFQIYADDKKIKEVVNQTSRLNDAMSAARGIPLARAHITFGGYYDGF